MGSPMVIRYADDFVVLCHTRQEALEVKARLASWLTPRGLAFNEDKTRVVSAQRRLRLPRVQRPPIPRQAADQTQQGGRQTDPGEAPHRAAVPARDQRSGGDQTAQPDHPGLGRLLPDTGIQRDVRHAGPLPVAAHLQVGHGSATEQAGVLGRSPGTSASSTRPGRTDGCSATAHSGAYHAQASPGPTSSATQIVKPGASPDDPALADYWAWRRRKAPLPINHTALRLHRAQDGRCAICKAMLVRRRGPATNPTPMGDLAGDHPQDDRRHVGPRQPGQSRTPSHPPPLPPRQRTDTANRPTANRACSSRMLGNGHVRFLRGVRHGNVPDLPDNLGHARSPAGQCRFHVRLACESEGCPAGNVRAKAGPAIGRASVSAFGCQLGLASSTVDGMACAAGRSLPAMKLAFALMAAINGSTGSWVTLSHGL